MSHTDGTPHHGGGRARPTDPLSSQEGAQAVDARGHMRQILEHLYYVQGPRNAWEIVVALGKVPMKDGWANRFASLRRQGAVRVVEERRMGGFGVSQQAYVITGKGIQILRNEVELITNPPLARWEQKGWLRNMLQRVAEDDNTSPEIRDEILQAIAAYRNRT
jgi:hypothetical protein